MELDFKCRLAVLFIATHTRFTVVVLQIRIENNDNNNNNKKFARCSCIYGHTRRTIWYTSLSSNSLWNKPRIPNVLYLYTSAHIHVHTHTHSHKQQQYAYDSDANILCVQR